MRVADGKGVGRNLEFRKKHTQYATIAPGAGGRRRRGREEVVSEARDAFNEARRTVVP